MLLLIIPREGCFWRVRVAPGETLGALHLRMRKRMMSELGQVATKMRMVSGGRLIAPSGAAVHSVLQHGRPVFLHCVRGMPPLTAPRIQMMEFSGDEL